MKKTIIIIAVIAAIGYFGYHKLSGDKENAVAAAGAEGGAAQAVPVTVSTVNEQEVELWSEFSGRLEAVDSVDIRPRVGGTIDKILFTEGAVVKEGQPLFVIDTKPYDAALASSQASLTSAQAQLSLTVTELARAEKLLPEGTITQREYDARSNNQKVAEASVKSAEAALKLARLNLDYANIKAPISGVISRAEITAGNLIEAGPNAPVLTRIVSNDKIYAEFNVDEQTYLRIVNQNASQVADKSAQQPEVPVEIILNNGGYSQKGIIKSFDNKLDTSSGTIRARAIFDNKDGKLIPGLFAKVRLGNKSKIKTILISDKAISTDQSKKFVYIVNAQNKVEYREVKIGSVVNGMRVVESGLQTGERIVVNGIYRVRPDVLVAPEEEKAEAAPAVNVPASDSAETPAESETPTEQPAQ